MSSPLDLVIIFLGIFLGLCAIPIVGALAGFIGGLLAEAFYTFFGRD